MRQLPIFLNVEGRPVILIGTGDAADAKARLLTRAGARIVGEDVSAALAVVALDDADAAYEMAGRLRSRGVLVNVVDRPELCDFTLPAIVDRDPVLVAIGTAGRSAGLAKALRQRFEALLPADLGRLADALHAARTAIRSRWPDAADRRRAIDDGLTPGGRLDPLAAAPDIAAWLNEGASRPMSRVEHIALRSPDPDDLTLREARLLGQADHVFHAVDAPAAVLARARADAVRVVGQPPNPPPAGLSLVVESR